MHAMTNLARGFILLCWSTMMVDAGAQTVILTPRSLGFSGIVGGPNPPPQTVATTNGGVGTLSWRVIGSIPQWLSVSPQGGSAPGNVSFAVNIAGLRAGTYRALLSVTSNDLKSPTRGLMVTLVLVEPGAIVPSMYEVELRYTGYTGLVEGYPNCAVNTHGTDVLNGTVFGIETSERNEDVVYSGTVERTTAIDFCQTKGRRGPGPDDDERAWCVVTLTGWAI
jgi:Viral BACON domain